MALAKLGDQADSYGNTLIDIAEIAFARPHFSLRLVGVVESKKALSSRIKHILSRPFPKSAKLGIAGLIAIVVTAAVLLPMARAEVLKNNEGSKQNDQTDSQFKGALPNGATIELLGVCDYPSESKQWWRPDGKALGYNIKTLDKSKYQSDRPGYEFVFRKTGDVPYKIEEVKGSNIKSNIQVLEPQDLYGHRVHVKSSYKKTDIKIASPSGKWDTVVTSDGTSSTSGKADGKVIILAAAEQAGDDLIISSSDAIGYKNASRIIVIDSEGIAHVGVIGTDTGINNLRQRTVRFEHVDIANIAKIEFQICPYQYFTFKNVSLKPNFKTDVKIEVEKINEPLTGLTLAKSGRFDTEI